jgi:hypothetical protein
VSNYLNAIEKAVGCQIVRGRAEGGSMAALLKTDSDLLRTEREGGKRRASVRDFHSLRITWVTLALTAGVPLELVQKVTGHKTTDIVLKHYFQPGREAFRQALNAAMPKLLTNGNHVGDGSAAQAKSPKEQIRDIAETATRRRGSGTWPGFWNWGKGYKKLALKCSFPGRFTQQALGHNSKAVHHAYSKHAEVTVPSLDDWEKQWKKNPQGIVKPAVVQVDFRSGEIDPRSGVCEVSGGAAEVASR